MFKFPILLLLVLEIVACSGGGTGGGSGGDSSGAVGNNDGAGVVGFSAKSIFANENETCVITQENNLVCWGYDIFLEQKSSPHQILGIEQIGNFVIGRHKCARKIDGSVSCWGTGFQGQLMNNLTQSYFIPTAIGGLAGNLGIAGRMDFSCALMADRTVKCAGDNSQLQLGNNNWPNSPTMTTVSGLANVAQIAAGTRHACALLVDGTARCWGVGGSLGRTILPNQIWFSSSSPVLVENLSGIAKIKAGDTHTCAITSTKSLWCWGPNYAGEVGDGTTTLADVPHQVIGLSNVLDVAPGISHTCALLGDGTVRCWGSNNQGQLGNGTQTNALTPVAVPGLTGIVSMASGKEFTCAVNSSGKVFCWGSNSYGVLNSAVARSLVPVAIN